MKRFLTLCFSLCICTLLFSQENKEKSTTEYDKAILITPTYTLQIPVGTMASRFGINSNFGMAIDYKFGKNWQIGLEGNFLFGNKVKESNHFSNLLTANNALINSDGGAEELNLSERGTMVRLMAGKSFPFKPSQPNGGLLIKFGAGYMMHKILIDVEEAKTPQLSKEYQTGYDRLSHGFTMSQFIGIMKLERGKYVNLYLGLELVEGFTKNARNWDFYEGEKLNEARFDFLIGIKLGWMIPVFTGKSTGSEYYYY
ncbi:MAG: hypothetical protein ACPG4Z_01160 [Chitinophagales bacterium]